MVNDRTATFFSEYAPDFESLYGTSSAWHQRLINRYLRKSMRLRFGRTIAGCDPIDGRSVLDVGCGPGHYGIALARRGAGKVLGIDFAPGMIELARKRAAENGVSDRCEFRIADIRDFTVADRFDYVIVMGFMDYISEPGPPIERLLGLAGRRAFFSFPKQEGFLAWQRRFRYRFKCPLYMYRKKQVPVFFAHNADFAIELFDLGRDYFVVAERKRG